MWENSPNLMENFNLYFQEAQQTPCRTNIKNPHQDIADSNCWKTKEKFESSKWKAIHHLWRVCARVCVCVMVWTAPVYESTSGSALARSRDSVPHKLRLRRNCLVCQIYGGTGKDPINQHRTQLYQLPQDDQVNSTKSSQPTHWLILILPENFWHDWFISK